jgi:hypothetical protein
LHLTSCYIPVLYSKGSDRVFRQYLFHILKVLDEESKDGFINISFWFLHSNFLLEPCDDDCPNFYHIVIFLIDKPGNVNVEKLIQNTDSVCVSV